MDYFDALTAKHYQRRVKAGDQCGVVVGLLSKDVGIVAWEGGEKRAEVALADLRLVEYRLKAETQ
jgi:hypothetical protein